MGVRLVGPAPSGTKSYKPSVLGDIAGGISRGYESYKALRDTQDEKALKALMLQSAVGAQTQDEETPFGEGAKRAFKKKYGTDDEAFMRPAMEALARKEFGLKTPAEERDQINKELKNWDENRKRLGLQESMPPQTLIQKYEKYYGAWPEESTVDPASGQPISRKVPYRGQENLTPSKIISMVQSAVKSSDLIGLYGDSVEIRPYVESQMEFVLGKQWKQTRPDVASLVEQTLTSMGVPSSQPQTPRAIYNAAREAGKSPEEAKRIAGL